MTRTVPTRDQLDEVTVLGRDETGVVAESHGMRYYLTDCCGASAKGVEYGVACRSCYRDIDPSLGAVPDRGDRMVKGTRADKPEGATCYDDLFGGWWVDVENAINWVEIYGDGIPWTAWADRAGVRYEVAP